jgi:hypothetical protein
MFERKALNLYRHSKQTYQHGTTKIGMGYLGPNLTLSAKFIFDWFTGSGAPKSLFHVYFGFLNFCYFSS